MKIKTNSALFLSLVFLSACVSFRAGTDVQSGRRALLTGNGETALAYFQSAAQQDPNYYYGSALKHGILSYIGRSEYAVGRYPQARETLEKALSANKDDNTARLYLGLALARSGDRQRGLSEIETGMKGIHEFIEYITQAHRFSFGQFWDPARQIRAAIQTDLAMISGRDLNWDKLIADGEWIGKEIEEEGDRARNDESRERSRDGERGDNPN
jgi:tetratricopeptide (TPR) repeat protein